MRPIHLDSSETKSARRDRMALEVANLGTWNRDMKSNEVEWSPMLCEIFGLPLSQMPKSHEEFFELIHPDDHELLGHSIEAALRNGESYTVDFRYKHSSGEYRWMNGRGRAFYGPEGELLELAGTGLDITEQKNEERLRRERESQLSQIGDNLPDGALYQFVTSGKGENKFVYWSAGIERLIGVSAEEALADPKTLDLLISPEHLKVVKAAEARSFEEHCIFNVVVQMKHAKTGEWRWVHLRSAPRTLTTGETVWDGIYLDVTAAKEAERRMLEADHRKNEFLAMLAHELRNPLSAIRNALELVGSKLSDTEMNEWAMGVLDRQSKQLVRLVDDLLDVSRITRDKIELRKVPVEVTSILDQAIETIRPLISEHKITLIPLYAPRERLIVDADPARLQQIVINLLNNAVKFTEQHGHVWLSTAKTSEGVAITVKDSGIGIAPEKIEQMFELFAQGKRSLARTEGGLGLGLTIARKLARMHGGEVIAESEGLGKGASFTVIIPAEKRIVIERTPSAHTPEKGGGRVLVVDDNVDSAQGLARILNHRGYQVEIAYDGPTAIERACKYRPHYILLDLGLPGIDGYEVARKLRASSECETAQIIAISGYGQPEDLRRSAEKGLNHHLVKPVDISRLMKLLQNSEQCKKERSQDCWYQI